MTTLETDLVLRWLRSRGKEEHSHPDERVVLQRALRNGEPISRDIRDAMADWLLADPRSLLPGLSERN